MKKMRNGKRGFTLTEIVVVVAVIVILASASVLGIIVTVNKAQYQADQLEENNGANFEYQAWKKVNTLGKGLAKSYTPPTYKPHIDEVDEKCKEEIEKLKEDGYSDEEIIVHTINVDGEVFITSVELKPKAGNTTSGGASGGTSESEPTTGGNNSTNTSPTPSTKPSNTPTPTPKPTNTPTPTTKPAGSGAGTVVPSSSYSRSDVQYNWGNTVTQSNFNFGDSAYDGKKVTVTITYSGNVSYNQNSNFNSATASGNTVTCVIDNYSHYTTNYGVTVNGNVKVTNVVFSVE
jgi:prepilin-type N-terminal cleavage/methylation domain-containing protein